PRPPLFPYTTLFRSPHAGLDAVMQQHILVMPEQRLELLRERRVGELRPGLEVVHHLAQEPGPAVAAAADHHTGRAGFAARPLHIDRKSTRLNSSHVK